jgi:hypothetical protein
LLLLLCWSRYRRPPFWYFFVCGRIRTWMIYFLWSENKTRTMLTPFTLSEFFHPILTSSQ